MLDVIFSMDVPLSARTEATRDLAELLTAKAEGGMKFVNPGPELPAPEVDEENDHLAKDIGVQKPAKKFFGAELMKIPHKPLWVTKI